MNPRPRLTFLLEPVGVSLMEALLPRNQKEPGRVEEQPMEVSVWGSPGPVLRIFQEPGTSPEGPVPRSWGAEKAEENAERTAEPTEASDPEVPIQPQEPTPGAEGGLGACILAEGDPRPLAAPGALRVPGF